MWFLKDRYATTVFVEDEKSFNKMVKERIKRMKHYGAAGFISYVIMGCAVDMADAQRALALIEELPIPKE